DLPLPHNRGQDEVAILRIIRGVHPDAAPLSRRRDCGVDRAIVRRHHDECVAIIEVRLSILASDMPDPSEGFVPLEFRQQLRAYDRDFRLRVQQSSHLLRRHVTATNDEYSPTLRFDEDWIQRHLTPFVATSRTAAAR